MDCPCDRRKSLDPACMIEGACAIYFTCEECGMEIVDSASDEGIVCDTCAAEGSRENRSEERINDPRRR